MEYNERVYGYNQAFANDGRVKVLVVGNSFARDWTNILLENDDTKNLDISYFAQDYYTEETAAECDGRIEQAKYIFYIGGAARNPVPVPLPEFLEEAYGKDKVYIIGIKNFGECNGIIYNNRGKEGYYDQSIILDESYLSRNEHDIKTYGNHLIDLIGIIQNDDGSIPVFTPDGRFISQDCVHLTHAGAQYYAELFDLSWIT